VSLTVAVKRGANLFEMGAALHEPGISSCPHEVGEEKKEAHRAENEYDTEDYAGHLHLQEAMK